MYQQIRIDKVEHMTVLGPAEKADQDQNVKLTETDKTWLTEISSAVSAATGNPKYGASTVVREAIRFYRAFFSHRDKLLKYRQAVIALLDSLP